MINMCNFRSRNNVIIVSCVLSLLLFGCERNGSDGQMVASASQHLTSRDVAQDLDNLYRTYLRSTNDAKVNAARRMVEVLESSDNKYASVGNLWLAYSRLAYAEVIFGQSNQASIAFEKARYWRIVNLESSGTAVSNIVLQMASFTREKCFNDLEKWDANER